MDIYKSWETALKNTEIIRSRVKALATFSDTSVPYILLSESAVDHQDTIVRKGAIVVQRPAIVLPPHIPQFEGFDFEEIGRLNEEAITNFLLVRGVTLPSLKYQNQIYSLDLLEDKLKNVIEQHKNFLQEKEDVHTGLIIGPNDCWQFSLLIFICMQVAKNVEIDMRRLLEEYKKSDDTNIS